MITIIGWIAFFAIPVYAVWKTRKELKEERAALAASPQSRLTAEELYALELKASRDPMSGA